VKPIALGDDILLAIGRLIRACAEMEDMLTLFLCDLVQMPEGQFVVLLGRTPVSVKVRLAEQFAEAMSPGAHEAFKLCFGNDDSKSIFRMRNAVAHGLLLGETDEGRIAFRAAETVGMEGTKVSILVTSFAPEDFASIARQAEDALPKIENILKLQEQRAERRARPLDPHRKSQKAQQAAKRERRPRPSRP
jgi:hypothetical protein